MIYIVFAFLFAVSTPAFAHDTGPERTLIAQPSESSQTWLLTYTEPAGTLANRLLALYDKDGDGKITKSESASIAPILTKRALQGLAVSNTDWKKAKTKVRYTRREGFTLALLLTVKTTDPIVIKVADKALPLHLIRKKTNGSSKMSHVRAGEKVEFLPAATE